MSRALIVTAFCLISSGCNSWGNRAPTVLQRASPNPFAGHRGYAVVAVNFDHVMVNDVPVERWRTSTEQAELRSELPSFSARFIETVTERCASFGVSPTPGGGVFVIQPTLINVGEFASTSRDQSTRMTVRVLAPDGAPLDVVMFYDANGGYSVSGRLRHAGTDLGRQFCKYLRERSLGE